MHDRQKANALTIPANNIVLSASSVHKSFGRDNAVVHAVAGVDIELAAGEVVAIMGASGSGKTTLLHLLSGLLRPDSGSIRFCDREFSDLSDSELTALRCSDMGVVFQSYNLLPTLTALDNVALPLMLAGVKRSNARSAAHEKLRQVEMGEALSRRPPELSGGEQQRVAIARALVSNPRILLADEPTGNLDRKNAEMICILLHDIGVQAGRAVAMVTHDPFVAGHTDRVVVLVDGRVADSFARQAVGTIEDLALRCLTAAASAGSEARNES